MKILLTGSEGFVGSNLTNFYRKAGYEVVTLDRRGTPDHLIDLSEDNPTLTDLIKDEQIDVINHQAAQVDLRTSLKDPLYDLKGNVQATLRLLAAAQEANVKRFVFASSAGAIDSDLPSSPYGISKLTIEKYLHFYKIYHGMEYVSLRYTNVYGPRQRAGVVGLFLNKMLKQEELTVNGGNQTRDYVHVFDVCQANKLALEAASGVYNVSTGVKTDLRFVVNCLVALTGYPLEVEYGPYIKGEVMHSSAEPTEIAGWKPTIQIADGLRETVEYYKQELY